MILLTEPVRNALERARKADLERERAETPTKRRKSQEAFQATTEVLYFLLSSDQAAHN